MHRTHRVLLAIHDTSTLHCYLFNSLVPEILWSLTRDIIESNSILCRYASHEYVNLPPNTWNEQLASLSGA